MRTVIDLPDDQIASLKDLAESLDVSRAELTPSQRPVCDVRREP